MAGDPFGYEIYWGCNVSQNVWNTPRNHPSIHKERLHNQRTGVGWMVIFLMMVELILLHVVLNNVGFIL